MLANGPLSDPAGFACNWPSSVVLTEASVLITRISAPLRTLPKTVKPPFWFWLRIFVLSARLKKNWLLALFGSPPCLAMAMVPSTFGRLASNSFGTFGPVVTEFSGAREEEFAGWHFKQPP